MSRPIADASPFNWVDRYAPVVFRPIFKLSRWDRPIGGWLLLWPCWWSTALVALASNHPFPNPLHLALFAVGAFAMRGAGCTYNDIVDRHIDAQVERTRGRPLPSRQIGLAGACIWLALQALAGLAILVQFNPFTVILGLTSLLVVAVYPFMKRITSWPQAVLGLGFAWGALMGWAAETGKLSLAAFCLYVGTVCWIIGYDTIYACQDKDDDALIGIRSTARLFGDYARGGVFAFYGVSACFLALALARADASPFAFLGLAAFALHLMWQVIRFDGSDADRCLALFRANREAGALFFAGLLIDCFVRSLF